MSLKVILDINEEELKQIQELIDDGKITTSGAVRKLLSVWQYMDMAKEEKTPIYASLDKLHILNDAAIKEIESLATLDEQLRINREKEMEKQKELSVKDMKHKAKELYDTLEMKPGIFGFKIDLKKIGALLTKKK